tara:strand:+ start:1166 stop:1612 length:447 start_codon:yes stop_codon:yes gene_type:complete
LNKLLQVSRKFLLFIIFAVIAVFFITIILSNSNMQIKEKIEKSQGPNFDIINPSFTINNKQKISIKAEKGNFITNQKILLEKNVVFKSSKFNLQTDKAMFNKKDQTAKSEDQTRFQSKKTTIISEGFEITENGNIIFFNGKSKLNIKN